MCNKANWPCQNIGYGLDHYDNVKQDFNTTLRYGRLGNKSENEYENDDQKKYNHTDGYHNLSRAHIITVRDC